MSAFVSSYQRSGGGTVTRNADILPFPFPARPQAMTGYVRFVERGSILLVDTGIVQIGNSTGNRFRIVNSGGNYSVTHFGESTTGATLAVAPSVEDCVELVAQLNADGSVVLIQSINSAASTSTATSGAATLAPAWSAKLLYINSLQTTNIGFNAFRNVLFERGVQTLETMRRLAGVT